MELKDMKFDDLVDHAAGEIMKGLIAGQFRSTIFQMLDLAIRWKMEKDQSK